MGASHSTGRIGPRGRRAVALVAAVGALAGPAAPAADDARPAPSRSPQVWSVVVGVDRFQDPAVPAGRGAADAARQVQGWLTRQGLWTRDHVLVLTDFGQREVRSVESPPNNVLPTRANLDWAFDAWLRRNVRDDDLVLLYAAGPSALVANPDRPAHVLLPFDADAARPLETGWVPERALERLVQTSGVKFRAVCLFDTAPRPAGGGPGDGVAWLRRLTRWPGVSAWMSGAEPAEGAAAGGAPGPFTDALLAALSGRDRPNLAACLSALHQNPELRRRGFRSAGGVPPELSLHFGRLGRSSRPARPEFVPQFGHADRVNALAVTADGRLVATAGSDSTVRLWSGAPRSLERVIVGHEVGVHDLALSPDDRWLLSAGGRRGLLVHDLTDAAAPKPANTQPHESPVWRVLVLPDGAHAVTVDRGNRAFLWDLNAPTLQPAAWPGGEATCLDVAAGGDGAGGRVAAVDADGRVRVFDADGSGGRALAVAGVDRVRTLAVSPDGALVAAGGGDAVAVVEAAGGRAVSRTATPGGVERLAFGRPARLAVGHTEGVWYTPDARDPAAGAPLTDQPAGALAWDADGLRLAAAVQFVGGLNVWDVAGAAPRRVHDDPRANAVSLRFSRDGRTLFWGAKDGSLGSWGGPGADPAWSVPPHRGRFRTAEGSPKGAWVLSVDDLGRALVWDLSDRSCRRVPGRWASGAWLDDGRLVLAPRTDPTGGAGRPALVTLPALTVTPGFLSAANLPGGFALPKGTTFGALAVAPGGRRVAAAAAADGADRPPLVAVWDAADGRLLRWATADTLKDAVEALAFSPDGRHLAAGGRDRTVRVWDLDRGDGPLGAPAFPLPVDDPVTCLRFRPGGAGLELAAGDARGRVSLHSPAAAGEPATRRELFRDVFATSAHALWFSPDGKTLAAAGDSPTLWLGAVEPEARPDRAFARLGPHHTEQVNGLGELPVPGGTPLLLSASDDTTIRLWDPVTRELRGTFTTADPGADPPADGPLPQAADWIVYAPDGRFDATPRGRDAVRFRDRYGPRPVEQLDNTLYTHRLAAALQMGGLPVAAGPPSEPPALAIEAPRYDRFQARARLTVRLGATGLGDLRLYHNDAAIELPPPPAPGGDGALAPVEVDVHLVKGVNTFYAMASRPGEYDARSGDLLLPYEGSTPPPKLHVIAMGVGNYARNTLYYPRRDAERLSLALSERVLDPSAGPGERFPLPDSDVNAKSVNAAFDRIQEAVRDRPQDTVVVFLAGHTAVFADGEFSLLLTGFRFPEGAPQFATARQAVPDAPRLDGNEGAVLPFTLIAERMLRLRALKRLIIVDACQAEALRSDPQVMAIQRRTEVGTRRARTSYLLATRRGEDALEVGPLGHGLFTYSLLRGMGAVDPADEPAELGVLKLPPNADANRDGQLSTAELDAFARQALPLISERYPALAAARGPRPGRANVPPPPDPGARFRGAVDTVDSFILVPLHPPAPGQAPRAGQGGQ